MKRSSCEGEVIENNEYNRGRLARLIVEAWDIDDLVSYAIETLEQHYEGDNESFQDDAENLQ